MQPEDFLAFFALKTHLEKCRKMFSHRKSTQMSNNDAHFHWWSRKCWRLFVTGIDGRSFWWCPLCWRCSFDWIYFGNSSHKSRPHQLNLSNFGRIGKISSIQRSQSRNPSNRNDSIDRQWFAHKWHNSNCSLLHTLHIHSCQSTCTFRSNEHCRMTKIPTAKTVRRAAVFVYNDCISLCYLVLVASERLLTNWDRHWQIDTELWIKKERKTDWHFEIGAGVSIELEILIKSMWQPIDHLFN